MENNHLKLSVRRKAALCHLTGFNFFLILIPVFIGLARFNGGTLPMFITPTIAMMLATLLTIITWKINCKTHIFIDLSGRSAVNFMLSSSFYLFVLSTFLTITCGVEETKNLGLFGILYVFPTLCFVHFCFTIVGAIRTWTGTVHQHPLTIKFLSEVL